MVLKAAAPPVVMVPAGTLVVVRGLRRPQAAAYVGVSEAAFQSLVNSGAMPPPLKVGAASVWDVVALSEAFDRLKPADDAGRPNAFD